jgi:hypothetical protein
MKIRYLFFIPILCLFAACGGDETENAKPKTQEDKARDVIKGIMQERFGEAYADGYESLNFGELIAINGHIDTSLVHERLALVNILSERNNDSLTTAALNQESSVLNDSLDVLRAFKGYSMTHTYLEHKTTASDSAMIEVIYDEELNIRGIIVK